MTDEGDILVLCRVVSRSIVVTGECAWRGLRAVIEDLGSSSVLESAIHREIAQRQDGQRGEDSDRQES